MNFIGYVRVSTREQAKEGISLDAQKSKIRDYAKLNDLELEFILEDNGESGKNLKRDGIQKLIRLSNLKQINGIIVYKLDRLSRSVLDTLNLIEQFDKYDVAFHSITEKIDTKTAMGRFFITIISGLAQMERDLISERTKEALEYKRSIGGVAGGVPYGYSKKGKKDAMLIKDENEQRTLRMILDLHQQSISYNAICNELNKNGVQTRCKGKWYPQTVKSIIKHSATAH